MKLTDDGKLLIRKAYQGGFAFDLNRVFDAEARISEIAIITPQKAPELLATFNKSYLDLDGMVKSLKAESNNGKKRLDEVEADILLEKAGKYLEERGIKPTDKTRHAVVVQDPEYQQALDIHNALVAGIEYLSGKQEAIRMAWSSVKKIVGEDTYNMAIRGDKGGGRVDFRAGVGTESGSTAREQFGRPNLYEVGE